MERSQNERLWMIGGGLVAFVAILIGWFFFISPQRSDTDSVNGQADSARAQNAALQLRITQLKAENSKLPTYKAQLAAAQLALPGTSGLSDFVRTVQSIGSATQTDVSSLAISTPTTSTPAAPVAAATGSAGQPGASTPTSGAATTAPGTGAAAAPTASVYALAITAQASGTPAALNRFLAQLQSVQPRAVLITGLNEGSGAAPGAKATTATTTLQLTMQAFVAPSIPVPGAQLGTTPK
ncbi:MAG TPA: hypothetical protein VGN18_05010 [Jatrophihabitans sp.]|jgi:hypothetical protein|uniref:hypothetical protein n=1 Tax=Jatrophihabitans sp. TaxID=1932789 RepID=UPI002DFDE6E1|nr:hypothetical protein [Jatrophihabitans sp.]